MIDTPRPPAAKTHLPDLGIIAHNNHSDFAYGPFRQGMRELGYVEGKNLVIE